MKVKCITCKKEINLTPCRIKRGGKCCSKKCINIYIRQTGSMKGINYKKECWQTYICLGCKKEFKVRKSDYKHKRKYCSIKCFWKYRKLKLTRKCNYCNKIYIASSKNRNLKFCCQKHYNFYSILEKHPLWRGGKSYKPYKKEFNKYLKEKIRERDGYKCQLCGVPKMECIKKLGIHHIDYNKKNDNINNLITLCISCHSKTNYNREYWINYFYNSKKQLELDM